MTRLDILQPNIIHGRPRAIRTLTKRARLFYYTKDSSSNENKYVDHLSFFLRKTTTTATLDKTEKDLLGPLLVRVFDLTNHLFICTTLCRLKNYFLSYYVFHIYRIGELAQMVERPLCMREVPGSIPGFSKYRPYYFIYSMAKAYFVKCWPCISFANFNI